MICHAAESYLARPYDARPRPASPDERPPYQGANPVADVWSARALEYGGRFLRRAVADADDLEARGAMMLAATMAGVGFGSAGVHIPHACAYPIAGLKHAYQPPGYPDDHPLRAARPLGDRHRAGRVPPSPTRPRPSATTAWPSCWPGSRSSVAGPDTLPEVLRALMRDVDAPRGIAELGYDERDVPALVEGALKQQRLLVVSPREVSGEDLGHILNASMTNW